MTRTVMEPVEGGRGGHGLSHSSVWGMSTETNAMAIQPRHLQGAKYVKRSKAAVGLGWASWKESLLKPPPKPFSRTSWNFRHLFQSVNLKPALCMQPVSINASGIRTEGASAHSHRLTWWDRPWCCQTRASVQHAGYPTERNPDRAAGPEALAPGTCRRPCSRGLATRSYQTPEQTRPLLPSC